MPAIEGIFVRRIAVDQWRFCRNDPSPDMVITYRGAYQPILFGVLYTLQPEPVTKIIHAERIWNEKVHAIFFPHLPYRAAWDENFYLAGNHALTPACLAWLAFNCDFFMRKIYPSVPDQPPIPLASLALLDESLKSPKALEEIVYALAGRSDPLAVYRIALHRIEGCPMTVVRDACMLQTIHQQMKRKRRVWLSEPHLTEILIDDEPTLDSLSRLIAAGALRTRVNSEEKEEIAIEWAAAIDSAVTGVVSHNPKRVPLGAALGVTLPSECNRFLRADHLLEAQQLPLSMCSKVTWLGANIPPLRPFVATTTNRETAHRLIRDKLAELEAFSTIVTFSSEGLIGYDEGPHTTARRDGELAHVKICMLSAERLLVSVGGAEARSEDRAEALLTLSYAARQVWEDIRLLEGRAPPSVLIGIFEREDELDWLDWVARVDSPVKILVRIA